MIARIIIYLPLYLYFVFRDKDLLKREVKDWYSILPLPDFSSYFKSAIFILSFLPEFRSLLYFRFMTHWLNPIKILYPPQTALSITNIQNIGSGLVIQHGASTRIGVEKMGNNCQVWQNVTIGKRRSGKNEPRPTIGNNVKICCNSVVLGGITIGDNVTIGASTVVIKDVPANCTVVGNPARIV